jgi:hypothetical protein
MNRTIGLMVAVGAVKLIKLGFDYLAYIFSPLSLIPADN